MLFRLGKRAVSTAARSGPTRLDRVSQWVDKRFDGIRHPRRSKRNSSTHEQRHDIVDEAQHNAGHGNDDHPDLVVQNPPAPAQAVGLGPLLGQGDPLVALQHDRVVAHPVVEAEGIQPEAEAAGNSPMGRDVERAEQFDSPAPDVFEPSPLFLRNSPVPAVAAAPGYSSLTPMGHRGTRAFGLLAQPGSPVSGLLLQPGSPVARVSRSGIRFLDRLSRGTPAMAPASPLSRARAQQAAVRRREHEARGGPRLRAGLRALDLPVVGPDTRLAAVPAASPPAYEIVNFRVTDVIEQGELPPAYHRSPLAGERATRYPARFGR